MTVCLQCRILYLLLLWIIYFDCVYSNEGHETLKDYNKLKADLGPAHEVQKSKADVLSEFSDENIRNGKLNIKISDNDKEGDDYSKYKITKPKSAKLELSGATSEIIDSLFETTIQNNIKLQNIELGLSLDLTAKDIKSPKTLPTKTRESLEIKKAAHNPLKHNIKFPEEIAYENLELGLKEHHSDDFGKKSDLNIAFTEEKILSDDSPGEEDSKKYNNPNSILRSIYSSACQRERNPLYFKCLSSQNPLRGDNSENMQFGADGFLKVNSNGEIMKDKIIIVSDDNEDDEDGTNLSQTDDEFLNFESVYGSGLPDCSNRHRERVPVLIVSTLDGQISGLNYESGEVLWSHPTGTKGEPLLSSTMSKLEVTSRGEWVRLIPSLNGGIYRFDGENVEPLPVTADTLLHSSFKFNEDTIFSGGKYSSIIGIAPHSGQIKYSCDSNGCPQHKQSTSHTHYVLVVKRVSQTVRAIDPKAGSERWNFIVGEHTVNLANTGCESSFDGFDLEASLPVLRFVLPKGMIVAVDEDARQVVWKQKLPSPIVSAWSLMKGNLVQLNLFSSSYIPALLSEDPKRKDDDWDSSGATVSSEKEPALYVGIYNRQLYIQHNTNSPNDVSSLLQRYLSSSTGGTNEKFPRVRWKPHLSTAMSRTPVIHHTHDQPLLLDYTKKAFTNDLVVRYSIEYTYDTGYYLFRDDDSAIFNESEIWKELTEEKEDETFASQIYLFCFGYGRNTWWQLIGGLTIYGVFHVWVVRYFIRRAVNDLRERFDRRVIDVIAMIINNILREHPQVLAIIQRLGIAVAPLPPPAPPDDAAIAILPPPERQDSGFASRYISDFEPVRCLGKGGFGVVFHVRNKLDENEYAIKRILLPSKESSAERVKREVRALAKLNHPNIVRYYNSWLETPPVGWLEEADAFWRKCDHASTSLLSHEIEDTGSVPPLHPVSPQQSPLSLQQPCIIYQEKKDESLSGVINKLNANFLEVKSNDEKLDISSSDPSSSDNNSVSGYHEDDEGESDSSEDSISFSSKARSPVLDHHSSGASSYNLMPSSVADDSFEIVFEDKPGQPDCEDDSTIFANPTLDIAVSSHPVNAIILTANDLSKLTCTTSCSVRRGSTPCSSAEGTKAKPKRNKSSSFSLSSTQEKFQLRKRRRVKSQEMTRELCQRPSSLDLSFSSSRDVENQKVPFFLKESKDNLLKERLLTPIASTPNPRTYLYIQMELCQKESLRDWLSSHQERDKHELCTIFNDIVLAVEYVHDRSLMHRDLKPSNIFFSLDGEIKIGDFGLVTSIEEENDALTPVVDDGQNPRNPFAVPQQQRTLNAGTHLYMSPEQMSGLSYTYKVDIFSLGLIFFEMLVPFCTEMERRVVMLHARDKMFPPGFCSSYPDVEELLQLALHRNPNQRPTTRGIRARQPLESLQKGEAISPEEHFHLANRRGHSRSHSGSYSGLQSSSASAT